MNLLKVLVVLVCLFIVVVPLLVYMIYATIDDDDDDEWLAFSSKSQSNGRDVILTTIACGDDLRRDMAANLFRSMLMFADYDHSYTFVFFTDQRDWHPYFREIHRNFTTAEPKLKAKLVILDVPTKAKDAITDQFKRCAGYRITPGFYKRLILQGYTRLIYVDADTLIWDNIAGLWQLWDQIDGKALGLVTEALKVGWYYQKKKERIYQTDDVFGPFGINSGVVLWDAQLSLEQELGNVLQDIISGPKPLLLFDQDALNIACQNPKYPISCELLPCRWNFRHPDFSGRCLSELYHGVGIIHANDRGIEKAKQTISHGIHRKTRLTPMTLWWTMFPCYNRQHCLTKMEIELSYMISRRGDVSLCDTPRVVFNQTFEGSEFEYAKYAPEPNDMATWALYCRQLRKVQRVQQTYSLVTDEQWEIPNIRVNWSSLPDDEDET